MSAERDRYIALGKEIDEALAVIANIDVARDAALHAYAKINLARRIHLDRLDVLRDEYIAARIALKALRGVVDDFHVVTSLKR